jgi:type VI secretion system secreted protein Hcp
MAVECFLKIEGPDLAGESQADEHEDEIDVLSWAWGVSQSGTMHTATGGGAGKANVRDLSITKNVDAASPNLLLYCLSGVQFEKATLTCRKVGGDGSKVPYLTLQMDNVIITNVSPTGAAGGDQFAESLDLNFADVTVKYTKQNDDGSAGDEVEAAWSIRKNKKL